jgi:hypothetical protein
MVAGSEDRQLSCAIEKILKKKYGFKTESPFIRALKETGEKGSRIMTLNELVGYFDRLAFIPPSEKSPTATIQWGILCLLRRIISPKILSLRCRKLEARADQGPPTPFFLVPVYRTY